MNHFDHEPTISELLDLFEQKELYIPEFIGCPKDPLAIDAIEKAVKKGLRRTFVSIMHE